jgi:hypothetical protein
MNDLLKQEIEQDIDLAIEQAKAELKARNLTEKVSMRAMEIYCQLRKESKKGGIK